VSELSLFRPCYPMGIEDRAIDFLAMRLRSSLETPMTMRFRGRHSTAVPHSPETTSVLQEINNRMQTLTTDAQREFRSDVMNTRALFPKSHSRSRRIHPMERRRQQALIRETQMIRDWADGNAGSGTRHCHAEQRSREQQLSRLSQWRLGTQSTIL
jgi:hypothetical protein